VSSKSMQYLHRVLLRKLELGAANAPRSSAVKTLQTEQTARNARNLQNCWLNGPHGSISQFRLGIRQMAALGAKPPSKRIVLNLSLVQIMLDEATLPGRSMRARPWEATTQPPAASSSTLRKRSRFTSGDYRCFVHITGVLTGRPRVFRPKLMRSRLRRERPFAAGTT
jgi:hypothetical protein